MLTDLPSIVLTNNKICENLNLAGSNFIGISILSLFSGQLEEIFFIIGKTDKASLSFDRY